MGNSPHAIDTPGELADLAVIAVLVLVAGLFLGGVALAAKPTLDEQVRYGLDRAVNGPPQFANETVVFTRDQIEWMNRVYRDSQEEFGWCLTVRGDRVEDMAHPTHLENITETHITFRCSGANGILHTHPGVFAVPELSDVDRRNLIENDLDISCVLSEPVPQGVTRNPVSLNCFTPAFTPVTITIVNGTDSAPAPS